MWAVSGGRWMGLGDAKLALSFGWLLGLHGGFTALFLAFILGAIVSIPLLLVSSPKVRRRIAHIRYFGASSLAYTMKSEIPFGPFLVAACFLVWFAQMYGLELMVWNIAL